MEHRSALELAIAVRNRETSVAELVDGALQRVERLNPSLAAFVRVFPADARRHAAALDTELAKGDVKPVFFGVPNGIKDIDITAGRTQLGSRAFRFLWSPFDGNVARAVRRGGFVVLGKLATSELALLPVTETDLHDPCRNPWDPSRSPGGSSGGSACAVASGMLPMAAASDGGGSIRIPAAFCHLFGYKPSRGAVPDFYAGLDPIGLGIVNCVAHTVDDGAAMVDVLNGAAYDPRTPPSDVLLARSRVPLDRPLRVRFTTRSPLCDVDPRLVAAVLRTVDILRGLGHTVEEGPVIEAGLEDFLPGYRYLMSRVPVVREGLLQPATRWIRSEGAPSKADVVKLGADGVVKVDGWFAGTDLWLTPTTAVLPPKVGAWRHLEGEAAFQQAIPVGVFTAMYNIGGQPAASVPAGLTDEGLPLGVQLAANRGDDALLLAVCRQLETAMSWRDRHPPGSGPG